MVWLKMLIIPTYIHTYNDTESARKKTFSIKLSAYFMLNENSILLSEEIML